MALVDYETVPNNPVGQVHRRVMAELADDIDFTVFAVRFDNPRPDRIRWVRVPALRRPLILLFVSFHLSVGLRHCWERARGRRFDVVQSIESASLLGDVVHAQFCHRWFLSHQWRQSRAPGYRGLVRGLFERAAARLEGPVLARARLVVAPSRGSVRNLVEAFPHVAPKARIAYNGVDIPTLSPPPGLAVDALRRELGLSPDRPTVVFVSLGHFERKGLPFVLAALRHVAGVDLVVVGGTDQALAPYRRQVAADGIDERVRFVGFAPDVRTYLWAADAFILPSSFEGFPLVALEAAASGLPLIATSVNGVEEVLVDGVTGFRVERTAESIADALERFLALSPAQRREMSARSRTSVERFSIGSMVEGWRAVYREAADLCAPAERAPVVT